MQGSPLEQFAIYNVSLFGYSVSWPLTNFLILALVILAIAILLFIFTNWKGLVLPSRWASFLELLYHYILGLLKENAGLRAQVFFPFLKVTFFFILASNLLGMFPYGYALTSQALITFLFSCSIFLGTILLGFRKHGINFFSLFFPSGSPAYMAFLLVPIEILSFIARPFSLGIRLFANMLAGHVLLKILSSFIIVGIFAVQDTEFSPKVILPFISQLNDKFAVALGAFDHGSASLENAEVVDLPSRLYYQEITPILTTEEKLFQQLDYILRNPNYVSNELQNYSQPTGFFEKIHHFLLKEFPKSVPEAQALPKNTLKNLGCIYSQLPHKVQDTVYLSLPLDGLLEFLASPLTIITKIVLVLVQLALLAAFVLLELGIAFLQAYVFVILTTIYINDSLQLH